jgi:hypothetical protein
MSWWNDLGKTIGNVEKTVGGWFGGGKKSQGTTTPNEQPLKSLINTRAKSNPSGFIGQQKQLQDAIDGSFKKGGHVKKTGIYKLHKGEEVIPKKKAIAEKMKSKKKYNGGYYGNNPPKNDKQAAEWATQQDIGWGR